MPKASKSGGIIDDIKEQIKKSGANRGKFMYFKPGVKHRVRFLQDLDDGKKILFHDSYQLGINEPCQEVFDRECPRCDDEDLRHRDLYFWCVWDYEAKEVKILYGAVNNVSPVPGLVAMYEAYGTLTDRDYIITKTGTGTTASFSIVPMDKVKFKNKEAKPFSDSKFFKLLDKAFPYDGDDEPKRSRRNKDEDDDDEPEDEPDGDDKDAVDYDDMSAKELYKLCVERGIKVKKKKDEDYYIEKLEEWDEEHKDEDTEDEDDDW